MIRDRLLLATAIAAGLATPDEVELYLHPPDPDPCDELTPEQRTEYVIRSCASGVWSTCPNPVVTINGQPIPPPPAHRIRGRGPRGRSPRGRGTEPPTSEPADPITDDESN